MNIVWIIALWILRILSVVLVVGTLLPLIRTGSWMVRIWAFPRLQLACSCLAVAAGLAAVGGAFGWRTDMSILIGLLLAAAIWQLVHVLPYTRLWRIRVEGGHDGAAGDGRDGEVRFIIANLDVRNTRRAEVAAALREQDGDVILAIELDAAWADGLAEVRSGYKYCVDEVRPDGLGIALWSKLPLERPEVRCLVSTDRPSIHADMIFPGGRKVRFVGIHPAPPGLRVPGEDKRYDSRIRDAELMLVAKAVAADRDADWLVAGDFNDVAWSFTTRLFERLSGLSDPRRGRGLFNSYHAKYRLLRYPLDHVFLSAAFRLDRLERTVLPGADHFGIVLDVHLREREGVEPEADAEDKETASEMIDEGKEDAAELGEGRGG